MHKKYYYLGSVSYEAGLGEKHPKGGMRASMTTSWESLHILQGIAPIDLDPIALAQSTLEANRRCQEQSKRRSGGGDKNISG